MDRPSPPTSGESSVLKTKTPRTPEGMQAKRESDRARAKTRINIGRAFPLWRQLRARKGFKSDPELAFYLLRACGEYPPQDIINAAKRKRGRPRKSTCAPPVQKEEFRCSLFESIQDKRSTDEHRSTGNSEICFELSPICDTDESEQTELRSEDELKTEDDKLDLDVCKVYVFSALDDEDAVPQSSTSSTTTEEIKEEPVETELQAEADLQAENKLDTSMGSVTTSENISHSYVQISTPVTQAERRAGLKDRPLMAKKSPLTGLFSICLQCGEPVKEYTTVSSGSLNRLQWRCLKGHLMWLFPNNNPA